MPSVGQSVRYKLTSDDAAAVNRRRKDFSDAQAALAAGRPVPVGYVGHVGNRVRAGEVYPGVVVRVWEADYPGVNLQVWLDGNDTFWATSRIEGTEPGQWEA